MFKLIGSWKHKYVGFQWKRWNYYIMITDKFYRFWGIRRENYDGLPITDIGLWYVNLVKMYSY